MTAPPARGRRHPPRTQYSRCGGRRRWSGCRISRRSCSRCGCWPLPGWGRSRWMQGTGCTSISRRWRRGPRWRTPRRYCTSAGTCSGTCRPGRGQGGAGQGAHGVERRRRRDAEPRPGARRVPHPRARRASCPRNLRPRRRGRGWRPELGGRSTGRPARVSTGRSEGQRTQVVPSRAMAYPSIRALRARMKLIDRAMYSRTRPHCPPAAGRWGSRRTPCKTSPRHSQRRQNRPAEMIDIPGEVPEQAEEPRMDRERVQAGGGRRQASRRRSASAIQRS